MHERIPRVTISTAVIPRLEAAGDGAGQGGSQIMLELVEGAKLLRAVHSIHIMAVG